MLAVKDNMKFCPLGELLLRPPRYGINAAAVSLAPGVPTYIRITDIDDEGRFRPSPKVGVKHPKSADYVLHDGELVFARTGASVGKSYLYDRHDGELVYAGFLINIAPDARVLNPKYLSLVAQTQAYWDWVARTSARSGQPGINGREYAQLPVPRPDIATQDAIADAMTDVDGLIATLGRLIAKKQAIKQGMMQQLLTGRTRLPDFIAPWREVRLGEVLKFQVGYPFQSAFFTDTPAGIRLVRNRDLKSNDSVVYYRGDFSDSFLVGEGDVLIGMDGDFMPCLWSSGRALLNQRVGRLVPKECHPRFMYFALMVPLQELESGTGATTVKHLSHMDVESIVMELPPIAEQRAIAEVLGDFDHDIGALRARLEKAKAIKRGMMQELLTGRTRLPVAEAVA
jgi:type I restriction enzyme S subunit